MVSEVVYSGNDFAEEDFETLLFTFGLELEEITLDKEFKIEIHANRPELLAAPILLKALQTYQKEALHVSCLKQKPHHEKTLYSSFLEKLSLVSNIPSSKKENAKNSSLTLEGSLTRVDQPSTKTRPHLALALLKDCSFSKEALGLFLDFQEKLTLSYGKNREVVSVGIHNASSISFPLHYTSAPAPTLSFQALFEDSEYTTSQLFEKYQTTGSVYARYLSIHNQALRSKPKDKAALTEACSRDTLVLLDAQGVVSIPPVINSSRTACSENTKDILLEVTGTDPLRVKASLLLIALSFSEYIKSVEIVKDLGPSTEALGMEALLEERETPLEVSTVEKGLGVDLEEMLAIQEDVYESTSLVLPLEEKIEKYSSFVEVDPKQGRTPGEAREVEKAAFLQRALRRMGFSSRIESREARGADPLLVPYGERFVPRVSPGNTSAGEKECSVERLEVHSGRRESDRASSQFANQKEILQRLHYLKVKIPFYRADILHTFDLLEEVAIAFDLNTIPKKTPDVVFFGGQQPLQKLKEVLRGFMCGEGFQEANSFALGEEKVFTRFLAGGECLVKVDNPMNSRFGSLRPSLIPGLLSTAINNINECGLPLSVFEVNDTVTGHGQRTKLGAVMLTQSGTGLELLHGLIDSLTRKLGVRYALKEDGEIGWMLERRRLRVLFQGEAVGVLGTVNKEVLDLMGVKNFCFVANVLEIDLTRTYSILEGKKSREDL